MYELYDLDDCELEQIFSLSKPCTDRVKKLIQEEFSDIENEDYSVLHVLRDEAFGHYWRRVIDRKNSLNQEDVNVLLCNEDFPTSKSLLGESIMENKVNVDLCGIVLNGSKYNSWLYKQAKSFILLQSINDGSVSENMENLFKLECIWALHEIIKVIDDSNFVLFSNVLESNESITRKEKNRLRNKIKKKETVRSN